MGGISLRGVTVDYVPVKQSVSCTVNLRQVGSEYFMDLVSPSFVADRDMYVLCISYFRFSTSDTGDPDYIPINPTGEWYGDTTLDRIAKSVIFPASNPSYQLAGLAYSGRWYADGATVPEITTTIQINSDTYNYYPEQTFAASNQHVLTFEDSGYSFGNDTTPPITSVVVENGYATLSTNETARIFYTTNGDTPTINSYSEALVSSTGFNYKTTPVYCFQPIELQPGVSIKYLSVDANGNIAYGGTFSASVSSSNGFGSAAHSTATYGKFASASINPTNAAGSVSKLTAAYARYMIAQIKSANAVGTISPIAAEYAIRRQALTYFKGQGNVTYPMYIKTQ